MPAPRSLLSQHVAACQPLVYLGLRGGLHLHRAGDLLEEVAAEHGARLITWDAVRGFDPATRGDPLGASVTDPFDAVRALHDGLFAARPRGGARRDLFALNGFDLFLPRERANPILLHHLIAIRHTAQFGSTVLLVGEADAELPGCLADLPRVTLGEPDLEEIAALVSRMPVDLDAPAVALAAQLVGLGFAEVEDVLARALAKAEGAGFTASFFGAERARLLAGRGRGGGLRFVTRPDGLEALAGVAPETLGYVRDRVAYLAGGHGRLVRGVAIGGVHPGIGKTHLGACIQGEMARAGLPAVELDLTAMLDSYVGESERRLRGALEIIRTLGARTCVTVLLDEIDKVFVGLSSDGGGAAVVRRLLAQLLVPMADPEVRAYWILCAADLDLPEELTRSGRIDDVLWVGSWGAPARRAILGAALARHGLELPVGERAVAASAGLSPAELRGAVDRLALLRSAREVEPAADDLVRALSTVPSVAARLGPEVVAERERRARERRYRLVNPDLPDGRERSGAGLHLVPRA